MRIQIIQNNDDEKIKKSPWIEKYRPKELGDIYYQDSNIDILRSYIDNRSFPNTLLYGKPGTGKTSTILACCNLFYGVDKELMTMFVNGGCDRGVTNIQDIVENFIQNKTFIFATNPMFKSGNIHRMLIVDEADSLTLDAQMAIKKIMDTFVDKIRICFIANDIDKIDKTIVSRCTRFEFCTMPPSVIRSRLEYILQCENKILSTADIDTIIKITHGDMRQAINLLDVGIKSNNHANIVSLLSGQLNDASILAIIDIIVAIINNKRSLEPTYTLLNVVNMLSTVISYKDVNYSSLAILIVDKLVDIPYITDIAKATIISSIGNLEIMENDLVSSECILYAFASILHLYL